MIVTQRVQPVDGGEEDLLHQVVDPDRSVRCHAGEQHRLDEPRVAAVERAERGPIPAARSGHERRVAGSERIRRGEHEPPGAGEWEGMGQAEGRLHGLRTDRDSVCSSGRLAGPEC